LAHGRFEKAGHGSLKQGAFMSTVSVNFLHSASLRQRFLDDVHEAVREGRLSNEEQLWLRRLTQAADEQGADPLRVDSLLSSDGAHRPLDLATALMMSHALINSRVYLHTLAKGIEVFDDRIALLATLRRRYANNEGEVVFEYEKVEGDPFKAQMLAIVDHQVAQVGQMKTQLSAMPSLRDAAKESLVRQLRVSLPHLSLDPDTHVVHIAPVDDGDAEPDLVVQTLTQAAIDDCAQVKIENGYVRRFLNAQGQLATAADQALFTQAYAALPSVVADCHSELMNTFWSAQVQGQRTRRLLAIESFESSLCREVYDRTQDATLHVDTRRAFMALIQNDPSAGAGGHTLQGYRLMLKVGEGPRCPLAGTFVVRPAGDAPGSLLWFSPDHRLLSFPDLAALTAFLAAPSGRWQLRAALALADQPMLDRPGTLHLDLHVIDTALCAERVDAIIALQKRNLAYAWEFACVAEKRSAMIDDALDVRQLLDPRQCSFGSGRWLESALVDFHTAWPKPEVPVAPVAATPAATPVATPSAPVPLATAVAPVVSEPSVVNAEAATDQPGPIRAKAASWVAFVQAFDSRAEQLRRFDSVATACTEEALKQYLCVLLNGPVRARSFHIQWLEAAPFDSTDAENHAVSVSESVQVISMDLVSLFIECVTGHRSSTLGASAQIKLYPSLASAHIEVDLLNHMLSVTTRDFEKRYVEAFTQSRITPQRQDNQQSLPFTEAQAIREDAIRLDTSLAHRQGRIDGTAVTMIHQVLDRPFRALRQALGESLPVEVYSVSLLYDQGPGALLCDTLVIKHPQDSTDRVLLWSCEFGWRQFSSLQRLRETLRYNMSLGGHERWLSLLGGRDRRALQQCLLESATPDIRFELNRIDGHFVRALQTTTSDRQQQDLRELCKRARRCHLEANLFLHLASMTELDYKLIDMLDGLSVRIDNSIFDAMLPAWVRVASISDLMEYYTIFSRFYQSSEDGKDFLFGIPTLDELSKERLTQKLKRDFPGQTLDPARITITSRRYVSPFPATGELPSAIAAATEIHSETLVDYAINRYVDLPDATLSVQSDSQPRASALITPAYLRSLIREIDVGSAYLRILRKAFAPIDEHYLKRKHLFVAQLPSALLASALPEKVQGKLSAKAYAYIARILDMPDGIAREPIDDQWIIVSPLQLVADEGMTPDVVSGMYVICPAAVDAGPVVLYAIYHEDFVFREYANRGALMSAIRTDESLQRLLLQRVAPDVHRRYAHGGFVEPHLPFSVEGFNDLPFSAPGPVTLAIDEDKGNVLHTLFEGTLKLLLEVGLSNSVTNTQADQVGRRFLTNLVFTQALTLLPNKLAALVTLWQTHTLLRASARSAQGHRWGRALSEFTAALGVMVTAREQSLEEEPPVEREGVSPTPEPEEQTAVSSFSWSTSTLTTEMRARLQGLEAQNVALDEMRHDKLLNLYIDSEEQNTYAIVSGRVYQVRRIAQSGNWKIVGSDGCPGPDLILDSGQNWQLDLNLRLRGGGGAVTRFLDTSATASAQGSMVVEASGMSEIRQAYRFRARRIGEAHAQAKYYLENCLDNLNARQADGTLDPRVQRIVGDFFGTPQPDQALLTRIQGTVKAMFDALMDPSLSPFTSERFVVGTNHPGHGHVTAFVIPMDPQKRLFLTDRFFRTPRFRLTPLAAQEGFEATTHFQASTLLHELSHLVLDTKDIAYLESNAPYPDLLRGDTAANLRTRAQIERMQDYRLSHRTPKDDLFIQYDGGHWRDVRRDDVLGYSTILRITGAKTLDDARTVFLADVDKRSQIILKNADSVGLMILRLGRRNYTALNP